MAQKASKWSPPAKRRRMNLDFKDDIFYISPRGIASITTVCNRSRSLFILSRRLFISLLRRVPLHLSSCLWKWPAGKSWDVVSNGSLWNRPIGSCFLADWWYVLRNNRKSHLIHDLRKDTAKATRRRRSGLGVKGQASLAQPCDSAIIKLQKTEVASVGV